MRILTRKKDQLINAIGTIPQAMARRSLTSSFIKLRTLVRGFRHGRLIFIRFPRIRSIYFLCTTASFKVAVRSHDFAILCSSPAYASYDVFVHQLADLLAASFRLSLAI